MYENHTMIKEHELKVLNIFLDLEPHYFAEICKKTKLTRPRTLRVLRKLNNMKILNKEKKANAIYYSLDRSPLTYSTLALAEYSKTAYFLNKNKLIKRGIELLKTEFEDYLVIAIFGSYAKGYPTKKSDVDILILTKDFSKNDIKKLDAAKYTINGRVGIKFNPYLMKIEEFKKDNDLAKEIIKSHIIVEGAELFYRVIL